LHRPHALLQQQGAEHHVDQRIDEIAEAGIDHAVMVDRPDIEAPVNRQQQRAGGEACQHLRLPRHRGQPRPLAPPQQHRGQEKQRPGHPVRQDFLRRYAAQRLEIEWKQAPCQEGQGGVQHAGIHRGRVRNG
jgi:hypothetical protein